MNLKDVSIFKNLSDKDLEKLKAKADISQRTYAKGEHIFSYGEVTGDLYYLVDGVITVYRIDTKGKRFIIKNFDRPAIFGEVYSYLAEPFDFSAQAEKESKILVIKDFASLFEGDVPESFYRSYINLISKKCLELSRNNQMTAQSTLRQKISKYLLLNSKEGMVRLNISREEWADILATTRPSLSRELSNMVADGLIEIKDKKIRIISQDHLRDIL